MVLRMGYMDDRARPLLCNTALCFPSNPSHLEKIHHISCTHLLHSGLIVLVIPRHLDPPEVVRIIFQGWGKKKW